VNPRRRLIQVAALLAGAAALPGRANEDAWALLSAGGCAVLLRHAQTVPGVGDPPGFRLDDCTTQRNLSDAGRAESRWLGAEFERRRIRVDEVLTSRWCRCVDTARLAFPRHEPRLFEPLNSFFGDSGRREVQTARLRDYLERQPAGRCIVMVTHQVNITALTGEPVAMGEALLVGLRERAGKLLGRLRPA
jgi:broad specificity phosphatase PhoE